MNTPLRGLPRRDKFPDGRPRVCRGVKGAIFPMSRHCLAIFPAIWLSVATSPAAEAPRFNRDIRPILSQNCFSCHGPDTKARKGNLRLDLAEHATRGGESGKPAVVPGQPEKSELVSRILAKDPDDLMPPPDSHKELTAAQIDTLRRWIAAGAAYEGHWAFQAPVKPAVPDIESAGPNSVDHFIAARLRTQKLDFSPPAAPRALLRRMSFDLTGLPPSSVDLASFEKSFAANPQAAVAAAVDRLLSSPRFGEHIAARWLDAARYADTNGYSIDGGRHQWLWRDWVIKACNDNLPFDAFLTEQMAGDLLPDATEQQIVATGFHRNHPITHEGGTIPEENLVNYVADRVKTTSEAFLGLTMACAQCHDHKYDPFTQQDYYRFYAFFNTLDDAGLDGDRGVNARPSITAASCLATPGEADAVRKEIEQLQARLTEPLPEAQQRWENEQRADLAARGKDFQLFPLEVLSATSPNGSPDRIGLPGEGTVTIAHGDFAAYNVACRLPSSRGPLRGLRVVFHPAAPGNLLGFGGNGPLKGSFLLSCLTTSSSDFPAGNVDLNAQLPVARVGASDTQAGFNPRHVLDSTTSNGWAPPTGATAAHHLTVSFREPVDPARTPYLTTELLFNGGNNASPARFQLFGFTGNDDSSPHPPAITTILLADPATRTPGQAQQLRDYFHSLAPEKALIRHQLANLTERLDVLTKKHPVLVMNTSAKPRVTHVLERGVYSAPKEAVTPGTPQALPPLEQPADRPLNRLDLARWMTRPDHPLTARVAVNRLWEQLFGRGLAASSADFGSQSEWPSHPELLDWLAVRFVESGWNVKEMFRLLVTSRVYQQSADLKPDFHARDPRNEWLARGPRSRLSAEQVRDQALALSGLLVERLGGPSVRPYQPGDLWRQVSHYGSTPATSQTFVQDHGEKLYRRTLYTYWKRTLPPPNLATFDAPNREICAIGRTPTNTPLQALVTLNDPQFVEAARAFAQRLLQTSFPDDQARLAAGFEQATNRPPATAELAVLTRTLQRERQRYEADPNSATKLLETGESPRDPALPAPDHAAWTQLASLLLNLSETLTK